MNKAIPSNHNSIVLLLTRSYPFGQGEDFVATEIPYLLDHFSEVYLLPLLRIGNTRLSTLPENLVVERTLSVRSKAILYCRAILSVSHLLSRKWFWTVLRRYLKSNLSVMGLVHLIYSSSLVEYSYLRLHELIKRNSNIRRSTKIIIYSYWLNELAFAGTLLKADFPSTRSIARAHGGDLYLSRDHRGLQDLKTFFVSQLSAVVAISGHGKQHLNERFPKTRARIELSRLGTENDRSLAFASVGTSISIVSCSYCTRVKRLDKLIKALEKLSEQLPSIQIFWYHIGGGPLFGTIKSMANKYLSTNPRITHELKGTLSKKQIYDFYATVPIDVFVNTSSSEGSPVSIMEAMSFGIPIVAPRVGGIPEMIDESCGILFPEGGTSKNVAFAIKKVAMSQEQFSRKHIRQVWWEKYSAKRNYKAFCHLIDEVSD